MLNLITTLLEIAGAVLVVAALSIGAAVIAPAPWNLAAGLAVLGLGLVSLSFVLTRAVRR